MRKISVVLLLLLCACGPAQESAEGLSVEATKAGSSTIQAAAWKKGAMVSAANPHAVAAAIEMLQQGGHAVDAAIAAHSVLTLVEPQSSGIGGGAFMLLYDRAAGALATYDGRETAPAGASADMFVRDGEVLGFLDAWQSGIAVGVPGTVAMYELAHNEHGRLPWATLFEPAIRLAIEGFEVSPRLAGYLPRMMPMSRLDDNPPTAAYFYPEGEPLEVGHLLKNPEYADTLTRIAAEGSEAFYRGDLADQMAAAAQAEPNGGTLTVADIAGYSAIKRDAICGSFRDMAICSAPPPSSGVAQILIAGLYDEFARDASSNNDRVRAFVDAQRLAYADRDHFVADPDFMELPAEALIDPDYVRFRATERFAPDATPTPGNPFVFLEQAAFEYGIDSTVEIGGTTHLSIIDVDGNALSMTATVEAPFGSSRWAGGFLLNNQMTDFARTPSPDGKAIANAIAPGKRPRSSMTPTMVFDADNELLMVTGSPGGNSIVAYVAKTTIGVLDWALSPQAAADFPNIVARGPKVRVEIAEEAGRELAGTLSDMGYAVQERDGENSGIHLILVTQDGLEGAADKRREGVVRTLSSR